MNEQWIIGIRLSDRIRQAQALQDILTKYGCTIKTRLGLHETTEGNCSASGMVLLELIGDREEFCKLENELLKLEEAEVRKMVFQK
ncbi:MAG TPA: hypothetical protein PKN12_02105 [Bacteroidales bacterium]|nr:hypothetical protein [Bacteroidales bacterium]HPT09296.1 hypothetical protein [Bacteroidales bacterium]